MARAVTTVAPRGLEKLLEFHWPMLLAVTLICAAGIAMLYSVAGGSWTPWAMRQAMHFGVGIVALIILAMIDIRIWMSLAYPAYAVSLALLVAVELVGARGKGAERWLDLGVLQFQPSELMKIALVLALARYFHKLALHDAVKLRNLIVPVLMIAVPVLLVLKQPHLGTATILALVGAAILFVTGLRWWLIAAVVAGGLGAAAYGWEFLLHDYQKERVYTFLNPERDPLGAGYNIVQAKIAMGSGGAYGKGFVQGTQSQLDYVPEKQTDFIFVMLGEEMGFAGAGALLGLCAFVVACGLFISMQSRSQFGRIVAFGITVNFLAYVAINTAMVMGLIPVVGIPLALVSYGGTAMVAALAGFGVLMSVYIHREVEVSRYTGLLF